MELKDVIHFYLGCPVWICKNIEDVDVIEPLTRKMLYEDIDQGDMFFDPEDLLPHKLILRPLCSLTDEEIINVARLSGTTERSLIKNRIEILKAGRETYTTLADLDEYGEFTIPFSKIVSVLNYFRSIGIDIDGLIESGQAIDSTKL